MIRALPILLLLCALPLAAQPGGEARWKGLQFGNWTGAGTGEPGKGSGRFSFQPELNGQVVVRHNYSDLANGQRHDDLLVIYADGPAGKMLAMYFDSEGYVIRHNVSTPGPDRAVFESEGEGPPYRLSYWVENKVLKGKFEVGGRTYLEWDSAKDEKAKEHGK